MPECKKTKILLEQIRNDAWCCVSFGNIQSMFVSWPRPLGITLRNNPVVQISFRVILEALGPFPTVNTLNSSQPSPDDYKGLGFW